MNKKKTNIESTVKTNNFTLIVKIDENNATHVAKK